MKRIILPSVLLLMGVTEEAMAACAEDLPNCYTQVTDLTGFLPNKTVCDGSSGNWNGQEWHSGSSGQAKNLIDYKEGRTPPYTNSLSNPNSNPYGPSEPVGTWSISGDTVTYGYYNDTNNPAAGTVNYSNQVWQKKDGTYDFCDGNTLKANVTIQTGQGACTGSLVPIACSASAASSTSPASSTLIGSPAANVTSTKENEIQDKQEKPIESPAKDDDKQGKQAKPIAFPGPILPPTKEGNKQGEKDKSIVPPVKEGGKQVKPIVSPAKEGDKQDKQGN